MNRKILKGISKFVTAALLFSNLTLVNGVKNVNASEVGKLVISQYVETDAGTTPKGIELWNVSNSVIDFSTAKLSVLVGMNGGSPAEVVSVSSGTLAAGELIVIGTSDIKNYLNTQGLGSVSYVECGFSFNGDDSIRIKLGNEVVDTFGEPGKDPGTSWSGNGVSTANSNIQLKSGIVAGAPSTGWTDPSIRFETVGNGSDLTGFGVIGSKPIELTDAEAVLAAKANLGEVTILNGNASLSSVTKNLLLPATGINSTSISWSSTNAAVLSNVGTVKRPAKGSGNAVVELTATISKGIISEHKKFSVTVLEDTGDVYTGYYAKASGKTGQELKATLNDIIDNHKVLSYAAAYDALVETDRDPKNPNNVLLFYTNRSVNGPAKYNGGSGWNREHVWAKSHGNFGTSNGPGTDIHHLRPEDVSVNSDRGHLDFDNGGNPHPEAIGCYYDSDSFEPRDEVKGDVARIIFYMAVRYEGERGELDLELADRVGTYPLPLHGKLSVLLEWNELDPVSEFEMTRNNIIYQKYQNNRNPFIDHPEWANSIWGAAPNMTDEAAVASTKTALTLGDTSAVTTNIALPTSSINGASISWISSNTKIISNDGAVARPENGTGNATVKLTATIKKGNVTASKDFIAVVIEKPIVSKFSLKISNVTITDMDEIPITKAKQGETAIVNVNIVNDSDKIINGLVIVKLTGSDNRVIAIGFLNNTEIKIGASNEYEIGFTLNKAPLGICKAKVYVWDGLKTMNPLSEPSQVEFTIN